MVSFDPKVNKNLTGVGAVQPSFGSYTIGAAGRTEGGYPDYEQYNGELDTTHGSGIYGSVSGTNPDGTSAAQDIAKRLGMSKLIC